MNWLEILRAGGALILPPVLKRELVVAEAELQESGFIPDALPEDLRRFYLSCGGVDGDGLVICAPQEKDSVPDLLSRNEELELDFLEARLVFGSRDSLLLVWDWAEETPDEQRWQALERHFGDEIVAKNSLDALIQAIMG